MKIKTDDIIKYKTGDTISIGKVFKIVKDTVYIKQINNGTITNIKSLVWLKNVIKVIENDN